MTKTKLIKIRTVKSHLIVQFDRFNGHTSVPYRVPPVPYSITF